MIQHHGIASHCSVDAKFAAIALKPRHTHFRTLHHRDRSLHQDLSYAINSLCSREKCILRWSMSPFAASENRDQCKEQMLRTVSCTLHSIVKLHHAPLFTDQAASVQFLEVQPLLFTFLVTSLRNHGEDETPGYCQTNVARKSKEDCGFENLRLYEQANSQQKAIAKESRRYAGRASTVFKDGTREVDWPQGSADEQDINEAESPCCKDRIRQETKGDDV